MLGITNSNGVDLEKLSWNYRTEKFTEQHLKLDGYF